MRKNVFKITLAILLIAVLSASLVACGLFDAQKAIKNVDVEVVQGLEKGEKDGEYLAHAGEKFTLSANWHNTRVTKADIEWHEISDGNDIAIDAAYEKTYSRTFTKADLDKTFEFYVIVNGKVESGKISVKVAAAPLAIERLQSNIEAKGGVIQQNLLKGVQDVELSVIWNADDIRDDAVVSVFWYVDNVKQSQTGATFVYAAVLAKVGEVEIKAEITDGVQKTSATVMLVFVEQFDLAQSVSIIVDDDLIEVCEDTYYFKATADGDKTKSFSTTLLPVEANQNADCEWTLSDSSGQTTIVEKKDRSANVALSYGKNVLKASIENVESRQIIIYALGYEYDKLPTNIKTHVTNKFFWLGNYYDSYISSQADLNAYVGYAISRHQKENPFEMYVALSSWRNIETFSDKCEQAVEEGSDESGNFAYSISMGDGPIGAITLKEKTVFGIPTGAYTPKANSKQVVGYLRYSVQEQNRDSLPIDNATQSIKVENSNDLYRVVSCGIKPTFANDENGRALEQLYEKARDVLKTYVSDDMSEYEKVAIIYDWIINVVDYDYAVAELTTSSSQYNAFYLEGVFDDYRAVCDGKSKAFALLCGMEGIKAVRVVGYANKDLKNLSPEQQEACGHAWNKVLIDADGDGVREWYVVDTTWGDLAVSETGGKRVFEYLNYAYFLKSDADIEQTHIARTSAPAAVTEFNVYKHTFVTINGVATDLYIESESELSAILQFSKDNGDIPISVYIVSGVEGISYYKINLENNQYVIYAKA